MLHTHFKFWTRSSMSEEWQYNQAMLIIHSESKYIPSPVEVYERKSMWIVNIKWFFREFELHYKV